MILMSTSTRRPVEILIGCILILVGGGFLGAVLKLVLAGDEFPVIQVFLMGIGGALALLAGVGLLGRAMQSAGPQVLDGRADADQPIEIKSAGA